MLDEPTEGLDEKGTFKILDKLKELKRSGKTIIIASSEEKIMNY